MEAREKALELLDKYTKQYSLSIVEEIIDEIGLPLYEYEVTRLNYWENVKGELNKQ